MELTEQMTINGFLVDADEMFVANKTFPDALVEDKSPVVVDGKTECVVVEKVEKEEPDHYVPQPEDKAAIRQATVDWIVDTWNECVNGVKKWGVRVALGAIGVLWLGVTCDWLSQNVSAVSGYSLLIAAGCAVLAILIQDELQKAETENTYVSCLAALRSAKGVAGISAITFLGSIVYHFIGGVS